MTLNTQTLSLRMSEGTKTRLDNIAKSMRRSKSSLILEAIERHLDDIQSQNLATNTRGKFAEIMKFKSAGAEITGGSSVEEIDALVREMREDV